MKKKVYFVISAIAVIIQSCGGNTQQTPLTQEEPLNITIFIDLSDRIIHPGQPTQIEKDTAIVGHIAKYFTETTRSSDEGIQESKNAIQILFYPTPKATAMVKCADDLVLDIQKTTEGKVRRDKVLNVEKTFKNSLEQIYLQAIEDHDFYGCDIWGFFSNRTVDDLCIRQDYRNVLFILTDGYLFDAKTKEQKGDTSTFILPKVLDNPKAELKVARNDLANLEVAVMEIQPENPNHFPKMKAMLTNWLLGMGVTNDNITIVETGMPATTRTYIDRMLK